MMDDVDSEHAQIPVEMLQRHDYVTMYVDGVRYMEKAPLPYWIMAGIYSVAGVSEFSVRLELTLFALLTLLAVFLLGRELAGEEAGFYSALVLGTAIGPYIYTRFIIPDIMVCFWLTVTVYLFWRTLEEPQPSRLLCWSIGVVTALDVLTKGLIGLVFPIGIIGGYLLVTRNWRHLLKMRLASTTIVFLAVAAPWHVLATLRNPPVGEAKGFFLVLLYQRSDLPLPESSGSAGLRQSAAADFLGIAAGVDLPLVVRRGEGPRTSAGADARMGQSAG